MDAINRQWTLVKRPEGDDFAAALKWQETAKPVPAESQALVRTLYLSLDPANRLWMKDEPSYMPPVPLDGPMYGGIIGVVEASHTPDFAVGDIVTGLGGWSDYKVIVPGEMSKISPIPGVPLTAFISVLGATGLTAYFGLLDVGKPKAGQTVVVSAAAGAVGSIVGQIAKIKGCHVIGIAGSAAKCAKLTGEWGFDAAINYRTEDVRARLAELAPMRADGGGGVDVYFENVGGDIGNAVYENLAMRARVALCGMISQYNVVGQQTGADLTKILMRRATIEGFLILDYFSRAGEAVADLAKWVADGRIRYDEDVVDGLENTLSAFERLFKPGGEHTGKLIVKVGELAG
jgi:NADPH-dependent curcumin reductase CurA